MAFLARAGAAPMTAPSSHVPAETGKEAEGLGGVMRLYSRSPYAVTMELG